MPDNFEFPPKLIELQLLRHGEAQNQLLSPLTDYLALCGDHPSTTVRFPLKHRALMTRLRAMDYSDSDQTRMDQKDELASIVTNVLQHVPGLISELSTCQKRLAHLSIATSAAELSLMPFELALTPAGTPGADQPLCLQPHVPLCLTRRSRNVNRPQVDWKRPIRILMISSDAGGEIPVHEHFGVLRKAVHPWVGHGQSEADRRKEREKHLYLLHNPTLREVSELLRRESFSHVHLLAHGAPVDDDRTQFGVVFYESRDRSAVDIVNGERLGDVLGYRLDCPQHSPLVVSLAICHSGRQGSVMLPGSSMAFHLHDKGVPVVVGSQFPLSFEGSIVLTRELYEGLLDGKDPRIVIWKTRKAIFAQASNRHVHARDTSNGRHHQIPLHDWASMTVYAEFPDNFNDQLAEIERNRIVARIIQRMQFLDEISVQWEQTAPANSSSQSSRPESELQTTFVDDLFRFSSLTEAMMSISELDRWIRSFKWKSHQSSQQALSLGILASAQKRLGLVYLQIADAYADEQTNLLGKLLASIEARDASTLGIGTTLRLKQHLEREGLDLLKKSEDSYFQVFDLDKTEGWALVQSTALRFAVRGSLNQQQRRAAEFLHRIDTRSAVPCRRTWAFGALAELRLLKIVHDQLRDVRHNTYKDADHARCAIREADRTRFLEFVSQIRGMERVAPNDVWSSLLQLRRYHTHFIDLAANKIRTDDPNITVEHWNHEGLSSRAAMKRGYYSSEFDAIRWAVTELRAFVRSVIEPAMQEMKFPAYQ